MMRLVHMVLAALGAGLALAGPAAAANVEQHFYREAVPGSYGCAEIEINHTRLVARPGERNTVTMAHQPEIAAHPPLISQPYCGAPEFGVTQNEMTVVDATASIVAHAPYCRLTGAPVQNRAATCRGGNRITAILGDGDDSLLVETVYGVVDGGPGNDHIELVSGRVACGSGVDTVIAGSNVSVDPDCEVVVLR